MGTVHVIWHHVPNRNVSDVKECVGVVTEGWEAADRIVDHLNATDDEKGFSWNRNYWKEEVSVLTLADVMASA